MATFQPGDIVKGHFQDGGWYLATVESANADGTFNISWFDGDESCRVRRAEDLCAVRYCERLEQFVDCQQESRVTALDEKSTEQDREPTLVSAVRSKDEVAAGRILMARGDPGVLDQAGEPPLMEAAAANCRPLVALLLAARADPEQASSSGATPASLAAGCEDTVVRELLCAPPGLCTAPLAQMVSEGLSLEARHALLLASLRLEGKAGAGASPQPSFPSSSGRPTAWLLEPPGIEGDEDGEDEDNSYSLAHWMRPAGKFFSHRPTAVQSRQEPHMGARGARRKPSLGAASAVVLLDELLEAYSREDFVKACSTLAGSLETCKDSQERLSAIEDLCLRLVLGPLLSRYGFSPDRKGSEELKALLSDLANQDQAVRERNLRVMQLVMGHFRRRGPAAGRQRR